MRSVSLYAGRGFDLVENRLANDRLKSVGTGIETVLCLENSLEFRSTTLGILEELPDVAFDLVALPRQLLEEDGKLSMRVLIRRVQAQPK